jgi:hypothetical protein
MIHELKTWPAYFQAIVNGQKTFEIRKNDRNFHVDDELVLKEYNPAEQKYTGRELRVKVTYMTEGGQWGIPLDICVLGIRALED